MRTRIHIANVSVSAAAGKRAASKQIASEVARELAGRLTGGANQAATGGRRTEPTLSRSIADAVMKKVRL